ncbi:MAG TPA: YcxB family protein [Allosphingosinicella sp.]
MTERRGEGKSVARVRLCPYAITRDEGELVAGEISFQLTEDDFVAAHRDWLRDRFSPKRPGLDARHISVLILIFFLPFVWLGSASGRGMLPGQNDLYAIALPILLGLAFFWLCRLSVYVSVPRVARRVFRQRASFQRAMSFAWTEQGLGSQTAHGASLIPWNEFYRWHAGEHSFLFFADELMFYFIPRSALSNAQAQDLEATVNAGEVPLRPPA